MVLLVKLGMSLTTFKSLIFSVVEAVSLEFSSTKNSLTNINLIGVEMFELQIPKIYET